MTQPELEVVWAGGDSFNLLDWNETAYGDVLCEALGEGTEWGNPESIRRTLHRALAAGSALAKDGVENRIVTVRLRLSAADARALAGGEAVLHMLDDQRRVELRWTQPDEYAVPVAFVAVAVDLRRDYNGKWDTDENLVRQTWTLTFTCLPHVRSIEAVEIEAVDPVVGTPTTLDDCSTSTGWAASPPSGVTITSDGASVLIDHGGTTSDLLVTAPATFTLTKRYLAVEIDGVQTVTSADMSLNGGANLPLVGVEGGWRFYDAEAYVGVAITQVWFWFYGVKSGYPAWENFTVHTIGETESPSLTVARQAVRVIPTPGSAKADGSLTIESRNAATDGSGDALGTVIVYTGSGYDPRLSPHSIGTRSADTDALSGAKETGSVDTGTVFTFVRPSGSVPLGSYSVWVRAKGADAQTVTWHFNAGATTPETVSAYLSATPTNIVSHTFDGTDYNLFTLGTIDLPGVDVGVALGLDLAFQLLAYVGTDPDVTVDEVLLFNRSTGRLAVVDTSTVDRLTESGGTWTVTPSGGATRLWLDAASLEGNERILAGAPSKEMSLPLSLDTEIVAYDGAPTFAPGDTYVYVAATGTIDPLVYGTFRLAGHSSLAE